MTAQPTDLTTITTLQLYLNPGSTDTSLLQRLLSAASVAIQNYINRDIVTTSYTEVFDGVGGRVLVLPDYPITAVSALSIDGTAIPAGSVTVAGYYFTKDKIILNGYTFTRGNGNVAISYTAGYGTAAAGTIPFDIEQFCISLVQYWLGLRARNGELSRSVGGQTITYSAADMPESIKTGLNQYKRVVPS